MFYSNFVPKTFWDIWLRKISWPWNSDQRSLKVIGTDTDRSATYDFLLTFHSNHGPISHRFRDKWRFPSKIPNFPTPCICSLHHRWKGSLGIGYRRCGSKTTVIGPPGWTSSLTISSALWIQCINVTDGQTDTGRQQRPRLCIASRG